MNIAVLGGGGAMGDLFGGWLRHGGHDVVLVDVSKEAVAALNAHGNSIEEKDGSVTTVVVAATSDPASVGRVDFIVPVFIKVGDVVEIEAEGIGVLRNTIVAK